MYGPDGGDPVAIFDGDDLVGAYEYVQAQTGGGWNVQSCIVED